MAYKRTDASFIPYITLFPQVSGSVGVGGDLSGSLQFGSGRFQGKVGEISPASLIGQEVYFSGTVADGVGLTASLSVGIGKGQMMNLLKRG